MKEIIEELYLTNRAFITDDYDECLRYIDENILPLEYHMYPSGREIWNSWVIPKKWIVNEAYIENDGKVILDFNDHPLHLISYSDSFEGVVSLEELKKHLYYHPKISEAIPFHFRLNYRPWDSEWGFCISKKFYDDLDEGEYYVNIDTDFEDGYLKIAEHHLEGEKEDTILLIAHLDHTGMANDDLSGVSVGLEVINELSKKNKRKYSYKLLIVPEMLGSAAYLEEFESLPQKVKYGIFLEMLGNENRLALQKSFEEDTKLDRVAEYVLKKDRDMFKIDEFRKIICNDEIIFESPGYEIPTISISRYPYPEYHTHLDNPSIISEEKLQEAAKYILDVVDILERDFTPLRDFKGMPSLANPKYDLYIDPGQPALKDSNIISENLKIFRDHVFRYLEGDHSVFDITEKFELPFDFVHEYLTKFKDKNLVKEK
ncbi:MAG: DUF4910 domain-containing protein [Thermoplasmatota archaeon]